MGWEKGSDMAIVRFQGVQVTDAGQRALTSVAYSNNRGYGDVLRGQAIRKLERDGIVSQGFGPLGRSWGWWLTDFGTALFNHLHGWADAPVSVGDDVMCDGVKYTVRIVNRLEVLLRQANGSPWAMTSSELSCYWGTGFITAYVPPVVVCPVSAGDVLRLKGERETRTVVYTDRGVVLSDTRTYSVAAMSLLFNMGGFTIVPREVRRLSRHKSTSRGRARTRG